MPEIQILYEIIPGKELHRRNFPTKLMSLGIMIKLNEKRNIGQLRSPFLYKFDKEKYEEVLKWSRAGVLKVPIINADFD